MGLVRAVALIVVLNALALALATESSSAMTKWSGTCTFTGYSQFWPYRKWEPQPSGYYYRGTGTCDGVLNGEKWAGGATVDNYADMHQPMSCGVGGSTYGGPLYITFYHGTPSDDQEVATPRPPDRKEKATAKKKAKKKKGRRRRHHSHRSTSSRSGKIATNASDPQPPPAPTGPVPQDPSRPFDPNKAPPPPPAPNTGYPTLAAWSDEVNVTNKITSDLWGAYRGFAIGYGGFPDNQEELTQCGEDGVPGGMLTQTYVTITELHG
jgi:hypothetical protein